jgi:patatin-like phospholipase/acyl hydrolase
MSITFVLFLANGTYFADGGGVRGVSSLMILQELMLQINEGITSLKHPGDPCRIARPQDIFGLVAGTSTGGLISLMLGKLGMDVTNCLQEYSNFSEIIFKRKQFLAIGGFARSKYSGLKLEGRVRDLLQRHAFDEDLQMTFCNRVEEIAW